MQHPLFCGAILTRYVANSFMLSILFIFGRMKTKSKIDTNDQSETDKPFERLE